MTPVKPSGSDGPLSGSRDIGTLYPALWAANPLFATATGLAQAANKQSYVVRTGIGDNANGAFSNDGGQTGTSRPSPAARPRTRSASAKPPTAPAARRSTTSPPSRASLASGAGLAR
ncbi:hypothetical protein QF037_000109 [Streptomyces canus]|uniref:hypothetical protein n=1 Tax=Streptomyces canus TaxID=58343 RepID=UPI00278683BC|nr:hypothetical protein [Streptomyces canus]